MEDTPAGKKLESAEEHMKSALNDLHKVVVEKIEGYDEFPSNYYLKLRRAYTLLLEARASLNDE
jgi:hypothetical protein